MARNQSPNDTFDTELALKIASYLLGLKVPALQKLSVEARGSTVTLRGTVNSHFEKQLATLCKERIGGVKQLIDQIEVKGGTTFVPAPPPQRGFEDEWRELNRAGT